MNFRNLDFMDWVKLSVAVVILYVGISTGYNAYITTQPGGHVYNHMSEGFKKIEATFPK